MMAAMKRLLMEIMEDLEIDNPYDSAGYLKSEVQAEYDRRGKAEAGKRRTETIQITVEPNLRVEVERLARKADKTVSEWGRLMLSAAVRRDKAREAYAKADRKNRDEGKDSR